MAVIELLQYQKFYGKCDIFMNQGIPKSEIVYDHTLNAKEKFCMLYEKYINNNSRYAINISCDTHNEITEIYSQFKLKGNLNSGLDRNVPINVFNQCIHDLLENLHDSTLRFKKTDKFKQFQFLKNHLW